MSLNIIINYLDKYPLFSSKFLDYKDWKIIVLMILDNNQYTKEGIYKTEVARNSMNRQRTSFTWNHLNLFYT
jgi:hypothetical protein